MVRIREGQIHQYRRGEIVFRIIPGPGYSEADDKALMRETLERVGPDTVVRIEKVAALERSRSGKLRFVVSHLREGAIAGNGKGPEA